MHIKHGSKYEHSQKKRQNISIHKKHLKYEHHNSSRLQLLEVGWVWETGKYQRHLYSRAQHRQRQGLKV